MDYKELFEHLFDDLERAAFEDPEHNGYAEGVRGVLPKYAEQRGKGKEYREREKELEELRDEE